MATITSFPRKEKGQSPNDGRSPMKEVAQRRGKAAPHIRRQSRYQTRLLQGIFEAGNPDAAKLLLSTTPF